MDKKTRGLLSALLTFAMMFSLLTAIPLTASAQTYTFLLTLDQSDSVNAIQTIIQNAIDISENGYTVVVSGSRTGVTQQLVLDIKSGVKVVWKAAYEGFYDVVGKGMIEINGGGTFEVATGGSISQTGGEGYTIYNPDSLNNSTIKVSGGVVASASVRIAILSYNNVEVTGGIVENTGNGRAIQCSYGTNKTLTVSGGIVRAAGFDNGDTIFTSYSENLTVSLTGGVIEQNRKARAIFSHHSDKNTTIIISGSTVGAADESKNTIRTEGENTRIIIESGTVRATADSNVISTESAFSQIEVKGGAVIAEKGHAIYCEGSNSKITVSSGEVRTELQGKPTIRVDGNDSIINATGGKISSLTEGIFVNGANTAVNVSGGEITTIGPGTGSAVYFTNLSNNSSIKVSDGTVNAEGTVLSHAICSDGANTKVEVSGGVVSGFGEYSVINMRGANANVQITGGFIFGYGADIIGEKNVIFMRNGVPSFSNAAAVCAWKNPGGNPTYTNGTDTDLVVNAPNSTIVWARTPLYSGIGKYVNGEFNNMFVIQGITVNVQSAPNTPMSNFSKVKTYTSGLFTDVNESAWYGYNVQQVIARVYEYNLMQGITTSTFSPTRSITLAEVITVAVRVHGIYSTGVQPTIYSDNPSDPWYSGYINYAIANGIISASIFTDYGRAATRAEVAYIFANTLPTTEFPVKVNITALPDVNNTTPYSESIFMLFRAGVLTGNNDQRTFYPANNITRAEAAAIISRVILPGMRAA